VTTCAGEGRSRGAPARKRNTMGSPARAPARERAGLPSFRG
jgi:hypothetical protein